jgi:predicted anti-sigma-YlaC factor YlaD
MTAHRDCNGILELISAHLDSELSEADEARLDSHLGTCGACSMLAAKLSAQHRSLRVHTAERVPDIAARVVTIAHPPRVGRRGWIRQALATLGIFELVVSLPALVLGNDADAPVHVARHVGSLGAALGFALLYAAWKPTRAYGLLPFIASLAVFMTISSVLDLVFGHASFLTETTHLVELAGLILVWLLAGSPRPRIPQWRHIFEPQLP